MLERYINNWRYKRAGDFSTESQKAPNDIDQNAPVGEIESNTQTMNPLDALDETLQSVTKGINQIIEIKDQLRNNQLNIPSNPQQQQPQQPVPTGNEPTQSQQVSKAPGPQMPTQSPKQKAASWNDILNQGVSSSMEYKPIFSKGLANERRMYLRGMNK